MGWVKFAFLGAVVVSAMAAQSQAALIIDTAAGWNGTENIGTFGEFETATYGQTFTVTGTETQLNSFQFWLDDDFAWNGAIDFKGFVMEWNAGTSRATGSVLYESSTRITAGTFGMENFTFNTGGLSLVSGTQYVAFLSVIKNFGGALGSGTMGVRSGNPYGGGNFVYSNNSIFANLTAVEWSELTSYDAAFIANFSEPSSETVPEPGSILAMLSLVSFGAGAIVVRRRRAKTHVA